MLVLLVERYLFLHRLPPILSPPDCHRYSRKKGYCKRAGCSRYSEWLPERGATGKKTVGETVISTGTRPGKIEMNAGSLCDIRGRCLHPKTIDTEVESQLALYSDKKGCSLEGIFCPGRSRYTGASSREKHRGPRPFRSTRIFSACADRRVPDG